MVLDRGVPRGDAQDAQDARASPLPPLCIPPGHVHPPPPQPERLVMRTDEAVGNKKKMQVCLLKHNYKLNNNLLTVGPRAVLMRIRSRIQIQLSAKNVHPPWQNPRYAPGP